MMIKEMWGYVPTWMKVIVIVWLPLAIGGAAYSNSKCGFIETFMMGEGAFYAAYTGMCNHD